MLAPEWNLFLGADRTRTRRGGATFSQTAGLLGLQRFFFGHVYLGGALGLAYVQESGVANGLTDGPGYGFSTMLGIELLRTRHAALTAEVSLTMAKYRLESWEMGGVRLGVIVF